MQAFQSTYVGRRDFPKFLPDFMLRRWFTLSARDRHSIRKTFRSRYWIGGVLQLGFVGMTGTTLRSLEYVPISVLRHLGRQFVRPAPDIATLRTLYRRRKTDSNTNVGPFSNGDCASLMRVSKRDSPNTFTSEP